MERFTRDELGLLVHSAIEFSIMLEKWGTPESQETINNLRKLAAKIDEYLPYGGPGL